jgi:tetratricopeptide (TPR) repeat protein
MRGFGFHFAMAMAAAITLWTTSLGMAAGEKPAADDVDGRIKHAEELFEQGHAAESKQICESLLNALPDSSSAQRGSALNVMSKIYAADGDYGRAIAYAQQSAKSFEQIGDSDGQAHALNNKGIAELQTGTYADAEQDLQQALAMSRKANDLENQVQVLNNLGSAHYFRGSYAEATSEYETALALVNDNASAQWSDYWLQITKFNQATLLQRLGHYVSALRAYREVEASAKGLSGGDRAHLYANLGTLYRRLGDAYKALDAYRIAQQLYSKQHDADGEIAVLKNIGIAYALDLDDLNHAANIFRSALTLAEKTKNRREQMQAHLYLGETQLRSHNLAEARAQFDQAQSLANELATVEDQWKCLYGLGRVEALSGNTGDAERDYRQAISLIERTRSQLQLSALRSEFFADKREAYDALISILFRKNDVNEAFLFMEKSRARTFQDRVQRNDGANAMPRTIDQIRAGLPGATVLLEFWTSENQIGIVWCTRDAVGLQFNQLTPEQEKRIHEALSNLPGNLRSDGISNLDAVLPDGWTFPAGTKHLLIVPDAWISYVPFDLLHVAGNSRTLLDSYDISYLPSAMLLGRKRTERSAYWPWTRELVAFGDPLPEPKLDNDKTVTQRLPFSGQEIQDISHLANGRSQLFLQRDDLKKTFRGGAADDAFVLHVSTHAFADGNNPEDSRLLFSAENGDSSPSYVFLREIYDLDLRHVRLATISACDTERGKIIRGEGVQAFSRALLSAGADASVTALWRVDDESTAEFMKQFYFFLMKENQPKAEALRLAKLKFQGSHSKLADPAVWAAFVLNGDGLTPLPRVISWTELVLSLAAMVALLALIFAALYERRRRLRGL